VSEGNYRLLRSNTSCVYIRQVRVTGMSTTIPCSVTRNKTCKINVFFFSFFFYFFAFGLELLRNADVACHRLQIRLAARIARNVNIFRRFQINSEKRLIPSSCLSVYLSAIISAASTGRIVVNFYIGEFHENLSNSTFR